MSTDLSKLPRARERITTAPPAAPRVAESDLFPASDAPTTALQALVAPATLAEAYAALCAPFPAALVELKPGATTQDKKRALALAYVDPRLYQERLDTVVGPDSWQVAYRPLGERAVICRLQVLGIVREEVGETNDAKDPNAWTGATAQAFKRACSAFGLGRYLYHLPQLWANYDDQKRQIEDPAGVVAKLYSQAGL